MILAIDTSSENASVALGTKEQVIAFELLSAKRSAEGLLGAIDSIRKAHPNEYGAFREIAVCLGPGSYTGIRIGLSLAQGLAFGKPAAIVGVGSLLATLLASDPADGEHEVSILAREGEELFCSFRIGRSGDEFSVDEIGAISARPSQSHGRQTIDARSILSAAARIPAFSGNSQFIRALPDAPLAALYGKPVQAKTLAERGICVDAPR